jgi:hypothetical protein
MNDELWIRDVLSDLSADFAQTAAECVQGMFQQESEIHEPWIVAQRLDGRFEYVFFISSSNLEYKSTMAVGIDIGNISAFIGCDITLDEARDAFGEYANIYCGMIADISLFSDHFGVLKQGLPEEAMHQACFPDAWAVQGRIYRNAQWMHLGYAIGKNRCTQPL